MNFLELCQFAHRKIGAGDSLPGSAPLSVTPTDSLEKLIVSMVNDAYREIQRDQDDWRFMRGAFSFGVAVGASAVLRSEIVTVVKDFGEIIPLDLSGRPYVIVRAAGEDGYTRAYVEPYEVFRGWRDTGPSSGRPQHIAVANDDGLLLSPKTDKAYTLGCDYRRAITNMVTDTDTPIIPERYHEAIGYRATALYCEQRPDTERYVQMRQAYMDILDSMRGEQLEAPRFVLTEYYG